MPTFCRHNRFIERCPICARELAASSPPTSAPPRTRSGARRASPSQGSAREAQPRTGARRGQVRVRREQRAVDDGYRSALLPGVHSRADADRLAEEIGFASGRLRVLESDPPGLYGEVRSLAAHDLERATWTCFLISYLAPLQDQQDPFAGVRAALAGGEQAGLTAASDALGGTLDRGAGEWASLADLEQIPLGPRTSHAPARGSATLLAYWQWVARAVARAGSPPAGGAARGAQERAFTGDPSWTPARRFERLFERLALPGFGRTGRYDLLVTLGRLGLYELRPDSLALSGSPGIPAAEPTLLAAKRVFGIADPLLLDRRAAALADAASVPIEALDLALANWGASRATMGVAEDTADELAYERAGRALGL